MCRDSELFLIRPPLISLLSPRISWCPCQACHTSCLVPHFLCCVCSPSVDTVIWLFTSASGTIASVRFGSYLSHSLRATCSFLKRQHLPEWLGNSLNSDSAVCYPLTRRGAGRGLWPWLRDQLARDFGQTTVSIRVSSLGPVQIFDSMSTHRSGLPRRGVSLSACMLFL